MAFNISDREHRLKVQKINETAVTITVNSTGYIATMSIGEQRKFELDGDKYYDLDVILNSIKSNGANMTMRAIHEPINPVSESADSGVAEERKIPHYAYYLASGIIAILIVAAVVGCGKRRRGEYHVRHQVK